MKRGFKSVAEAISSKHKCKRCLLACQQEELMPLWLRRATQSRTANNEAPQPCKISTALQAGDRGSKRKRLDHHE